MVVDSLFKALAAGFTLWGTKEAHKYHDEVMEIKRDYYLEKSKPDYDMAVLGDFEHRLFVLSSTLESATVRGQAPGA